jgi:hypothetical protein
MSSVLLFRSSKTMVSGTLAQREGLVIEIEEWFTESQEAIKAEMETEYAVIPERRAVKREETPWVPAPPIIKLEPAEVIAVVITNKPVDFF